LEREKRTGKALAEKSGWGGSPVIAGILLVLLGLIFIYVLLAKTGVFQRVGDFVIKFFSSFKQ
jgi:hypothetical protein